MGQSLSRMFIHIIFSTKNRTPLIDDSIKGELFAYLGGICNKLKCQAVEVGGYIDHVHIFCGLSRGITVSGLVKELKRSSNTWIRSKHEKFTNFYWQDGYAVFTVSPGEQKEVVKYIQNQEVHHLKVNFKDECIEVFNRHGFEYDPQYVWE